MKKIVIFLSAITLLLLPVVTFGAQIRANQESINVASEETIDDDLYIATGNARIDGIVNGDVVVAGGQISIVGKVNGDVLVAGGQISIEGEVKDDVRVAAGNIIVSGKIGDDLIVAAGNIDVSKTGVIVGDVKAGAGSLTISGQTGAVEAGVGNLLVASSAKINGNLAYTSGKEAVVESGSFIKDGVSFHRVDTERGMGRFGFTAQKVVSMLMTLTFALLLFWFMPNASKKVAAAWKKGFGSNLLWGFIFLIAFPAACLIALITVLGVPLGLIGVAVYAISLYLAKIVAVLGIGYLVQGLVNKEREDLDWIGVVIGVLIYTILKLIPILGWLAIFFAFLSGLGALVKFDWNLTSDLRNKKIL